MDLQLETLCFPGPDSCGGSIVPFVAALTFVSEAEISPNPLPDIGGGILLGGLIFDIIGDCFSLISIRRCYGLWMLSEPVNDSRC